MLGFYMAAIVVHVCELDVTDEVAEKLEDITDQFEERSGIPRSDREKMFAEILGGVASDKAKACRETRREALDLLQQLR
jgi:hypothetical protein